MIFGIIFILVASFLIGFLSFGSLSPKNKFFDIIKCFLFGFVLMISFYWVYAIFVAIFIRIFLFFFVVSNKKNTRIEKFLNKFVKIGSNQFGITYKLNYKLFVPIILILLILPICLDFLWITYSPDIANVRNIDMQTVQDITNTPKDDIRIVPYELGLARSKQMIKYSNMQVGELEIYRSPNLNKSIEIAVVEPSGLIPSIVYDAKGYVVIDATDPEKVNLVEKELKYSENRFLPWNINFINFLNVPWFKVGDAMPYPMIIDNNEKFYWATPIIFEMPFYKKWVGVSFLDAETGEFNYYSSDDIPNEFLSIRLYPEELVLWRSQIYGLNRMGWLSKRFTKSDIYEMPEQEHPKLIVHNGEQKWFVAMEPYGQDEKRALVGYLTFDASGKDSGNMVFHNRKDTEFFGPVVARNYVRHQISNYEGWRPTDAILYKINGKESWIVPIVRGKGAGVKLVGVGYVNPTSGEVSVEKRESLKKFRIIESEEESVEKIYVSKQKLFELKNELNKLEEMIDEL